MLIVTTLWLLACLPGWKWLFTRIAVGLSFFGFFFLFTPWVNTAPPSYDILLPPALNVTFSIFAKGLCGTLLVLATVSNTTLQEFNATLVRLPLPRLVTLILIQVVHQTGVLARESVSMAHAMLVRGAKGGFVNSIRLAMALPKVWLPRILARSERVGMAMEIRSYGECFVDFLEQPMKPVDIAVLALTLTVPVLSLLLRLGN